MKKFSFNIIVVLIFSVLLIGCSGTNFSDIDYIASNKKITSVVEMINGACAHMINTLKLKVEYKTTNTYTFFNTEDEMFQSKIVRDEITTTLGNDNDNPAVSKVEKTRYVNNKKQEKIVQTYVKKTVTNSQSGEEETTSYVYILTESFDESGESEGLIRERKPYDSIAVTFLYLFNQVVLGPESKEIDKIFEKQYENIDYYKLQSDITGLDYVNDKFVENSLIFQTPDLFQVYKKSQNYVVPFSYEFGLDSSDYVSYFKCNYDICFIKDKKKEKYLTVTSSTNLQKYGNNVSSPEEPLDKDDYTQETFVRNLKKPNAYLIYKDIQNSTDYTKTTFIRLGEDHPDFSIKVDSYQSGSLASTNFYFAKYIEAEEAYKFFLISKNDKTYSEVSNYDFKFLKFNLSLSFNQKIENFYQYGTAQEYLNVHMLNTNIEKISTKSEGEVLELFVLNYGTELLDDSMVLSLTDFQLGD